MDNTGFPPFAALPASMAPSEMDNWRGKKIYGEIHDESAWVLRKIMVPGSAGLFSTVPDLLNFLQMLLNGGTFNNHRILSEKTVSSIPVNQISGIKKCGGLGWELNQLRFMGMFSSNHTIGKTGFTGCMILCDMDIGAGLAFLSNATYPHRPKNNDCINMLRREVADTVFRAMA
jgi:CubicO group peptidase (beta-lactamase class C family)